MDVAAIKKNYIDSGTSAKNASTDANQLMSDFSAAVAVRMSQNGKAGVEGSKNALIGSLTKKTEFSPEVTPQNESYEASAPADNNDITAPREPSDANNHDARRDEPAYDYDDGVRADAPRDTSHDNAPTEHAEEAPQSTPQDDQSSSQPEGQSDEQASAPSENGEAADIATPEAQVAAVQQVGIGEVTKVLATDVTQTATVKAVAADTSGSQKQTQNGKAPVQNVVAGPTGPVVDTADGPELAQKGSEGREGKAKATSAQGQAAINTHVKADAQGQAEKGPTVAQQQAADLAKKVGPNQNLNVNVNVTKQSEELVSKPTANLVGQTSPKSEGESLTPTTAQAASKGQVQQMASNNAGGQAGADAQGQNQQQAQLQAAQADAAKLAAGNSDAKAAQNANANSAVQGVKVGGAEGASTPQATAAPTAPAQQASQADPATKPQVMPHKQPETPVTEQVKVQISKAVNDGMDKIRIQLTPAHLGRVDVQLEMGQDGRVTAVISADNKDTMDMLKQDSRELERALREAGLNLNSGDLSFNMRGENGDGAGENDTAQGKKGPAEPILEPTLEELMQMQVGQPQIISEDRVDITA